MADGGGGDGRSQGRRARVGGNFDSDAVDGKTPERVISRCIRTFLADRLGENPDEDELSLEADMRAVLRLFESNVPEVAALRPQPPRPPKSVTRDRPEFPNDDDMKEYTDRVFGFIFPKSKDGNLFSGKNLLIGLEPDPKDTEETASFGPAIRAFLARFVQPIVAYLQQHDFSNMSIQQAVTAITDLTSQLSTAALSTTEEIPSILDGRLRMARALLPGFVHGGLSSVNLLRLLHLGTRFLITETGQKPTTFLPELEHEIRLDSVDYFRHEWLGRGSQADRMVNDEMKIRFLLAFLRLATNKTIIEYDSEAVDLLRLFHGFNMPRHYHRRTAEHASAASCSTDCNAPVVQETAERVRRSDHVYILPRLQDIGLERNNHFKKKTIRHKRKSGMKYIPGNQEENEQKESGRGEKKRRLRQKHQPGRAADDELTKIDKRNGDRGGGGGGTDAGLGPMVAV